MKTLPLSHFPVVHYEYTRPGKNVAVYDHYLVHDTAELKVLYMPEYASDDILFDGELAMNNDGSMLWFLFPEKWYDIGSFYLAPDAAGNRVHTGWYTNFCTPPRIEGHNWYARDLFLDHWLSATGKRAWLDEDEFERAKHSGLLSAEEVEKVTLGRFELEPLIDSDWPPESVVTAMPPLAMRIEGLAQKGRR